MSLLLDALKRAEQEKQTRQGERSASPGAAPAPAPGKPLLELAPIASPEPTAQARAAAAAALAPAVKPPAPRSRAVLWSAAAAIALVIAGVVAYVWYSLASLAPAARPIARAPVPQPIAPAPVASEPAAPAKTEAVDARAKPPAREPRSSEPARAAAPVASAAAPLLQASREDGRARIAPRVAAGYEALQRGDLAAARADYSAALAADGANLDAALGLATVEARGGRAEMAAVLYRRALEIDPRNATALAGLAALSGNARGESLERELLRDIAEHPDAASLRFALANLYASQSLWTQAQGAYFEAHRLDPGNPDILHNLAVSLDRIGQSRTAATYYRRALEAARTQASQLDVDAVTKRLSEIDMSR